MFCQVQPLQPGQDLQELEWGPFELVLAILMKWLLGQSLLEVGGTCCPSPWLQRDRLEKITFYSLRLVFVNHFFFSNICGEKFYAVIQKASILIEELTGDPTCIGVTRKQGINVLVVWQGTIEEVGQEP